MFKQKNNKLILGTIFFGPPCTLYWYHNDNEHITLIPDKRSNMNKLLMCGSCIR